MYNSSTPLCCVGRGLHLILTMYLHLNVHTDVQILVHVTWQMCCQEAGVDLYLLKNQGDKTLHRFMLLKLGLTLEVCTSLLTLILINTRKHKLTFIFIYLFFFSYPELRNNESQIYTQEQVRSLVSFAADRGIRVIPEVESA